MIKNIKTLVKIAEFDLNEVRRKLVDVQSKRDNYLNQIAHLQEEMQYEIDNLEKNKDSKAFIQGYINGVKERQKQLKLEAEKLVPEINRLLKEVTDKFREVKKYETVLENKLEELEYEERKKIQQELDEMAITRHTSSSSSN